MKIDRILLIVPNQALRRLYHIQLTARQVEVVAVDNITHGILMLSFDRFDVIVIHQDQNMAFELESFLKLRHQQQHWENIALCLLAPTHKSYQKWLMPYDLVIDPSNVPVDTTVKRIMACRANII